MEDFILKQNLSILNAGTVMSCRNGESKYGKECNIYLLFTEIL